MGDRILRHKYEGHPLEKRLVWRDISMYGLSAFYKYSFDLSSVVEQGFNNPVNVEIALDYLGKSNGIQRTRELARKHASLAAEAIESLPKSEDEDVRRSRRALLDLTDIVITITK